MRSAALRWSKSLWSHNPLPTGCLLYIPTFSPHIKGSGLLFKSTDLFQREMVVEGTTKSDKWLVFDGDDEITNPTFLDVMPSSDTLTFMCWAYFDALGSLEDLFAKVNINVQDRIILQKLDAGGSNKLRMFTEGSNGGNKTIDSTASIVAENWYLCGGVYKAGSPVQVYLAKATDSTVARNAGVNSDTMLDGTFNDFSIGSADGATFMTGRMGEVWVGDVDPGQSGFDYFLNQTRGRYA